MALVEFQNNSAPYLNAENLNNNFNEVNIVSEVNNEHLLRMNDRTVLKTGTDGSLFVSANNENVVFRPNGHNNSEGQATLSPEGYFKANNVDGVLLKSGGNVTGGTIVSSNGYGNVLVVSADFVCVIQLSLTTASIIDIYGTHGTMSVTTNGNKEFTISGLYSWDHYILIGSSVITEITLS